MGGGSAVCPAQAAEGGGVGWSAPWAPPEAGGAETVWGTPPLECSRKAPPHNSCPGGAWAAQFTPSPTPTSPIPQPSSPSVLPSLGLAPGWHPSPALAQQVRRLQGPGVAWRPRLSLPRARPGKAETVASLPDVGQWGQVEGRGLCEGAHARGGGEAVGVCVRAGQARQVRVHLLGPASQAGFGSRTVRQAQVEQDVSCRPGPCTPAPWGVRAGGEGLGVRAGGGPGVRAGEGLGAAGWRKGLGLRARLRKAGCWPQQEPPSPA